MLHLGLVQNLLSAVGAAPHLERPNMPQPAGHYPPGVILTLLPFGDAALRHFMFLERPEGMDLADAPGLSAVGRASPVMAEGEIVPRPQDFATVGHLYRSIEEGIKHLCAKYGSGGCLWAQSKPKQLKRTLAGPSWCRSLTPLRPAGHRHHSRTGGRAAGSLAARPFWLIRRRLR